jgi:hypothetical protein
MKQSQYQDRTGNGTKTYSVENDLGMDEDGKLATTYSSLEFIHHRHLAAILKHGKGVGELGQE